VGEGVSDCAHDKLLASGNEKNTKKMSAEELWTIMCFANISQYMFQPNP